MRPSARYIAFAFLGTLIWAACGGDDDSGSGDPVASCKQACNKFVSLCYPDAGGFFNCDTSCSPRDGGNGGGGTCSNASEVSAAYKACLQKNTCEELMSCYSSVPPCQGGTGSGGSGGGGGSGATGGTGGSTGGSGGTAGGLDGGGTCAQLLACCNAASSDQLKTSCITAYNQIMSQGDSACGLIYTQLKSVICP
jgi:hypothetical protein